jgi:hypothetical protein
MTTIREMKSTWPARQLILGVRRQRDTMRFRVEGTHNRGWSVGPWAIDAPSAEAAWLQAEDNGIVVSAVIAGGDSNGQPISVLDKRPVSLPPQRFAPSLAGVVWTILGLVDLGVCFMMVSASVHPEFVWLAVGLLVFLVAMGVVALVCYFQRYVDYKISQHHARSCLAEQSATADRPREHVVSSDSVKPA